MRRIASGPRAGPLGPDEQPDVYDELNNGLEYVQSMCEQVSNIKRRMVKIKELADKEMERVKKEGPRR